MKMRNLCILLLGMAAVSASAQDAYYAKLSWLSTQGDMRSLTNKAAGRAIELGAKLLEGEGLSLYVHGDFNVCTRKEISDKETFDAKSTMAGLDLKYDLTYAKIFTGPVLAIWDVTGNKTGPVSENGYKAGWRVGVEVPVYKNWGAALAYTATEWRSDINSDVTPGINPSNPSFLTFSVTYKF